MQSTANFYKPEMAANILSHGRQGQFDNNLFSLYFTEALIVDGAVDAGVALATFLQNAGSKPLMR